MEGFSPKWESTRQESGRRKRIMITGDRHRIDGNCDEFATLAAVAWRLGECVVLWSIRHRTELEGVKRRRSKHHANLNQLDCAGSHHLLLHIAVTSSRVHHQLCAIHKLVYTITECFMRYHPIFLRHSRTSLTNNSGTSHAAKCPPLSISFQCTMSP
jgi:hypothetical protein